ncbi:MAG TPA: DNA topoisomerase IV subunit B, partial [Oceanithermus profundus]|nr:DNA topoisomerase IV subunit B [Oceanithermus profundus]
MSNYDASSIKVLKGLEGVRHRPAMYIAGTGTDGYHQLLTEILDNSVDEALAGFADTIKVTLHQDGSASVEDNGRGVPVDMMAEEGKPAVEVIYTELHAGGKFEEGAYKVSGGLHGVGASVVNALTDWMVVEIWRGGKHYRIEFARGEIKKPLEVVGKAPKGKTGTRVHFMPDASIFEEGLEFDYRRVRRRVREVSYLAGGLRIELADERSGKQEVFHDKGGVASFARALAEGEELLYDKPGRLSGQVDEVEVDVGFIHTKGYTTQLLSYANMIPTRDGGVHLSGFRGAYTRAMNQYAKKAGLQKNGQPKPSGDDLLEGLFAVISVKIPQPQFEGQTKGKLLNPEAERAVSSVVYEKLMDFLESNPRVAKTIYDKAQRAAQAREAARKARELVRRQ